MKDKDLTKGDLQKIKDNTPIFDKETLPELDKDIDEILEELDKEIAKNKKIIEEIDRVLLETLSSEQLEKLSATIRLSLGFQT